MNSSDVQLECEINIVLEGKASRDIIYMYEFLKMWETESKSGKWCGKMGNYEE